MSLDFEFITAVLTIISIDIVLGGDNAIVVALACRNLPSNLRNKAMLLGIGFAIIARITLTAFAVFLLQIPFLMAIGGALLLYLSFQLLTENGMEENPVEGRTNLYAAIKTIIIADIVMGFDNVLAVAGAAHGNITLVIIGLIISVPIIIWGSKIILTMMKRYSIIIYIGAGILAFTATKMIIHEQMLAFLMNSHHLFPTILQFTSILLVIICGWFVKVKRKNNFQF